MGKILCSGELLTAGASVSATRLAALEDTKTSGSPHAGVTDLYDGPWGAALFWGALASSRPGHKDAAGRCRAALDPLLEQLDGWRRCGPPGGIGLGGFEGLGAPIYGLTVLGSLLGESDVTGRAVELAESLSEERIAADRRFDVVSGAAGLLLALLALDEGLAELDLGPGEGGRAAVLARAVACGEHLLATRAVEPGGGCSWPLADGRRQTGFAHGAAGIRHALLRLYSRTGERRWIMAGSESAVFESHLHVAARRAWLPFPGFAPDGPLMTAWCWGGPGIALSFAAAPEELRGGEMGTLLDAALDATVGQKATRDDYLCCGNLGRALILAEAARERGPRQDELATAWDSIVHGVLGRLKHRGDFGWRSDDRGGHPPTLSFMKGVPGVGYAFLALAHRLPMVLRLGLKSASKT